MLFEFKCIECGTLIPFQKTLIETTMEGIICRLPMCPNCIAKKNNKLTYYKAQSGAYLAGMVLLLLILTLICVPIAIDIFMEVC